MRPPQKALRGLRGSTNCREFTYARMSGRVCLSWVAFPHFDDVLPLGAKTGNFVLALLVNRVHGAVKEAWMFFVPYGITLAAAVPRTTADFVHGCLLTWSSSSSLARRVWRPAAAPRLSGGPR